MNCNTTHYRANSSSVPGDPTSSTSNALPLSEAARSTRECRGWRRKDTELTRRELLRGGLSYGFLVTGHSGGPSVPVLVYHRVHADNDPTTPPVRPDEYCGHVVRSEFERQMNYLADHGYRTITHSDLLRWLGEGKTPPAKAVAIDFDDNRLNIFQNALPILRERQFVATVFVITRLAEGESGIGLDDFPAMRWSEVGRLMEADWCVGSHTRSHIRLADPRRKLSDREIMDELEGSKEDIRRHLGIEAKAFAYPEGDADARVERMVRRVYKSARLWREMGVWQYVTLATNRYRLMGNNVSAKISFEQFRLGVELSVDSAYGGGGR